MNGSKELLTSQRNPDGVWHARYPTAVFTLCGKPTTPLRPGSRKPPTCDVCATTAQVFHQVDGSMPAHWLPADEVAA